MANNKHTPGPWEIRADPHHYDSFTTVVAGSGEKRKGLLRPVPWQVHGSQNPGNKASEYPLSAKARLNAAAPYMLAELMNYCAECCGNGAERCPDYNISGDMCRSAKYGTCDTWMTICRATGHDPATPWEVKK